MRIIMKSTIVTLLIACLFIGAGCSTISTLDRRSNKHYPYTEMTNECEITSEHGIQQQPVYSGSRNALSNIVYPWKCTGEECWGIYLYPVMLTYSLVDLPLSVIADTVALPYTYNLQYNLCPNVDWAALDKKRELLEQRIRMYYSDYQNPELIWILSSIELRGNRSLDEYIHYLRDNERIIKHKNGHIEPQTIYINKSNARILMRENRHFDHQLYPWYDYWVYENDNWYMDNPYRKPSER